MKRKLLLAFTSAIVSLSLMSQDVHFSNAAYSPLNLNPGLAGANYAAQAVVNYRTQWNSVGAPFQTIGAAADMRVTENGRNKNGFLALGVNFYNDRAGQVRISTNSASLNAAYHLKLDDNSTIGLGMYTGFGQRSLDAVGGLWGSQYDESMQAHNPALASGEVFENPNFSYFDVGSGVVYTYGVNEKNMRSNDGFNVTAGYSVFHINRPSFSFTGNGEDPLYMRHAAFAASSFGIKNKTMSIDPAIFFQMQGPANLFLIGADYRVYFKEASRVTGNIKSASFAFGAFLRARDAFIARFIYSYADFSLGMSYDFNVSRLTPVSNGRGGMEFFFHWKLDQKMKQSGSRARI